MRNVNVGSVYRSLVRASRSISDTCAVLVAMNYGEGHEIVHGQARAFFKHWIDTTHIEAESFSGKKIGEIRLFRNEDKQYQVFNASMSAECSVVGKSAFKWIQCNRIAMSSDALLWKEILSFVKKFFRPLDHIIFSLAANYDEKSFVARNIRVKINEFLTDLYAFTYGDQSVEIGDFIGFDSHPGDFGFSLLQTVDAYCMHSWFAYQEDYDRFAPLLLQYEKGRPGISGGCFQIEQSKMLFHEFIISMLSYCSSDAFYRKHFCEFKFNFDKSKDYKIAQWIIRLLDNNNLTSSDLGFSSPGYDKIRTLNDRFRFFMNEIKCATIKSVLERYIYSPDVQKKARKEMDYSSRVAFASEELKKIAEQAPKCAAQSSEDGMTSLLDGKTVSCFSEPAEPVESCEDRMKFLIVERCVSETLQDKFCLDDSSKHDENVLDGLKKLTREVHGVHYEVRFKYDYAEFDFKIFMKYLNLFIVNSYLKDEGLLKNAFEVLDNVSDKENINQITEYLHKEWVLLGGLDVCDFHPSSAIATNFVSSDDQLLGNAKELFSPRVSSHQELLTNLYRKVQEFRDLYQNLLLENIKKKFFSYISLLSYESLQGFSKSVFEGFPHYLMIEDDRDVRYMQIILERLSKYSYDGRWISLASFMAKITSDFDFFFDMMDEAYLQNAFDSVMVLHWRKKIGSEEAMEAIQQKYISDIVSILQQPFLKQDDLTQLEANHLHFQSELRLQKKMFSSSPKLFKAHDGFFIDAADACIEEIAIVIAFLKKLYNAGAEACIADFDGCLANLRVAQDPTPVSGDQKHRKPRLSKRKPPAASVPSDNNPSDVQVFVNRKRRKRGLSKGKPLPVLLDDENASDPKYPAAVLAEWLLNVSLSPQALKERSLARKEQYVHAIIKLKQECEKDVQMILSEAIADHNGCTRHDSLEACVEKILRKRGEDTFSFFPSSLFVNSSPKWPAAKIGYIRSLIMNDDFNRADNIVLFLKKSNIYFSYIKKAESALNELSIVSHPVLQSYCRKLMNERVDEAYTDWITDIKSWNSENELKLIMSYVFSNPYAVYLSQTERYKAEWDDLMSKVRALMTELDPKKYEELLRTQYSTTWSKSAHRSEKAMHLLWQRLRCEVYVTETNLKRLIPGFESIFTPTNPVDYNRIVAILKIIQKKEKFFPEFNDELIGGSRQAWCQSLAHGLKDRVLKKTMDKFIATVFKDSHFCETVTAHSIAPTFKAFTFLQLSHAAKQCLTGQLPAAFFAPSGLTELLMKRASSNKVVPLAHTASVPAITYAPEVPVSVSSSEQDIPEIVCEPMSLELEVVPIQKTPQAMAEEVLKTKILEIHKKILKAADQGHYAKFFLFCMPVRVKNILPATLQKLKNYIEQHPLMECDEIAALQEHVRALEEIVRQRGEYAFFLDPRSRADETEDFYKEILESVDYFDLVAACHTAPGLVH